MVSISILFLPAVLCLVELSLTSSTEGNMVEVADRSESYIEEGLYDCHRDEHILKDERLVPIALQMLKSAFIFRKKRQTAINFNKTVQKRMRIPNFAARTAAYKFCSAKQTWLQSGKPKTVGCAEEPNGTTLFIVCVYETY